MSSNGDALLLKGIAADLLEPMWRGEFYNDAEDCILYHDPEKKIEPKSEEEIEKTTSELSRLKNDLIDEIVEELLDSGISTIDDVKNSYVLVRKICHEKFEDYRRRFWNVVKPEFPLE